MKTHIHEAASGVVMRVEYEDGPEFHSIRLVDSTYLPVGPDLREFLHELVILGLPSEGSTDPSGDRYLSKIAEEIMNGN